MELNSFVIETEKYTDFINITQRVLDIVAKSRIKNGIVFIITAHTTTGITVNECLECLQSDMKDMVKRVIPEDLPYAHARNLLSYGQTAGNPASHLRAMLTGNHCAFPLKDGKMIRGKAQEIFFCEYDGAQSRKVYVEIMGE